MKQFLFGLLCGLVILTAYAGITGSLKTELQSSHAERAALSQVLLDGATGTDVFAANSVLYDTVSIPGTTSSSIVIAVPTGTDDTSGAMTASYVSGTNWSIHRTDTETLETYRWCVFRW